MNARFKSALFFILCATTSIRLAQAATCTTATGNTCTATDFTTATCTGGVCGCKSGYKPIPTGCAKQLPKPKVTLPAGRIASWVTGGPEGILTCTVDDDESIMGTTVGYKWFVKDENEQNGETQQTYTINDANKVGSIKCQIIAQGGDNSAVSSEMSDALVVTSTNTPNYTPVVSFATKPALVGFSLPLICESVPMGIDVVFSTSADLNSQVTSPITLDANDNRQLYCGKDSTVSAAKSLTEITITDAITSVKLTSSTGNKTEELFYNTGASAGPTFMCTTDPVGTANLEFNFQTNETNNAGSTYDLPINAENYLIVKCSASYNGDAAVMSSNNFKVTIDDDYIAKPVLTATATNPIEGSRVVMTCGEAMDGVKYSWVKGSDPILYQQDRMIQLGNVVAGDTGSYKCMLHKDTYVQESDAVSLNTTTTVPKPTITRADDGTYFGENGDYELICETNSETEGMVYSWKKDNKDLSNAKMKYTISDATATKHNGTYTCKIAFGNLASSDSDGFPIVVVAAGKACTGDNDCDDNDMYTGKCSTTEPKRCACESGYKMIGDACTKDGVSTIVGSTMLVLAAFIFSRLI